MHKRKATKRRAKTTKHARSKKFLYDFRLYLAVPAVLVFGLLLWYLFPTSPRLPDPPLRDLAAAHNIYVGSLVSADHLGSRPYRDIVSSQYSFLTTDGEAHWRTLRPSIDKYDYAKLDEVVTFAQENNMPVQLHHLVWGEDDALPDWLKKSDYSKEQILDLIHSNITNVVERYKGRITEWSVVNEAFSRSQHIYGLDDWWWNKVGGDTSYIDNSFIWARQADPNAKLILNDFYNEGESSVSDAMYNYIKSAKSRGVPIDGVGMQFHVDGSRPPNKREVIKNMRRFGDIGVPTYVTEFDVNVNSVKGDANYKSRLEAQISADVVRACIESKACVSFNVFGVNEKDPYIKQIRGANSRSNLFTSRYKPKQSFYAFRNAWTLP